MSSAIIKRLMALFEGFRGAHGTHGTPYREPGSLKWAIKKSARTLREPVTAELWEKHLSGKRPLGVIPINEENLCRWGSIDFDKYDADLLEVVTLVDKLKLPLVPGKSKSGGLHLWFFCKEPQPAEYVQAALREMAAQIGLAESEIFPKQTQILPDRGDLGSWIIVPYYGDTYGGKLQEQVGLKKTGAEMTIGEFVSACEKAAVDLDKLMELKAAAAKGTAAKGKKREVKDFSDGPPCLQILSANGIKQGGQNNALFMMGIYYRKKYPGDWQKHLEDANRKYYTPPLPSDQVTATIKSLEKKEYEYTCKAQPMAAHCDSLTCRMKKFGVGKGGEFPDITGMQKLDSDPPLWFVTVNGVRLELATEDLQMFQRFQNICMSKINVVFGAMKQDAWFRLVGSAMADVEVLPAPPELNVDYQVQQLIMEFLTNRQKGNSVEDILQGRPWLDEENGMYLFQIKPLERFIMRENNMRQLKTSYVHQRVKDMGGGQIPQGGIFIKEAYRRLWFVPYVAVDQTPKLEPPKVVKKDGIS